MNRGLPTSSIDLFATYYARTAKDPRSEWRGEVTSYVDVCFNTILHQKTTTHKDCKPVNRSVIRISGRQCGSHLRIPATPAAEPLTMPWLTILMSPTTTTAGKTNSWSTTVKVLVGEKTCDIQIGTLFSTISANQKGVKIPVDISRWSAIILDLTAITSYWCHQNSISGTYTSLSDITFGAVQVVQNAFLTPAPPAPVQIFTHGTGLGGIFENAGAWTDVADWVIVNARFIRGSRGNPPRAETLLAAPRPAPSRPGPARPRRPASPAEIVSPRLPSDETDESSARTPSLRAVVEAFAASSPVSSPFITETIVERSGLMPQLELQRVVGSGLTSSPPVVWLASTSAAAAAAAASAYASVAGRSFAGTGVVESTVATAAVLAIGGDAFIIPHTGAEDTLAATATGASAGGSGGAHGDKSRTIHAHNSNIVALASSAGRNLIATASSGEIKIWNPVSGTLLAHALPPQGTTVHRIALSADGITLAAALAATGKQLVVAVWDLSSVWAVSAAAASGRSGRIVLEPANWPPAPSVPPMLSPTASATIPKELPHQILFDAASSSRLVTISASSVLVFRALHAAAGEDAKRLRYTAVNLATVIRKQLAHLELPQTIRLTTGAFTNDAVLFVGTSAGSLAQLSLDPTRLKNEGFGTCCTALYVPHARARDDLPAPPATYAPTSESVLVPAGPVSAVSAAAGIVATACGTVIRIWNEDFSSGHVLEASFEADVAFAEVSPNGQLVAVALTNGSIGVLDPLNGTYRTFVRSHTAPILPRGLSLLHPHGRAPAIASAAGDATLRVWDAATTRQQTVFKVKSGVTCLCTRPGAPEVAAGFAASSGGGVLRVLNTDTLTVTAAVSTPATPTDVCYDPSGRWAAVTVEGTVFVLDATNGYAAADVITGAAPGMAAGTVFTPQWLAITVPDQHDIDLHAHPSEGGGRMRLALPRECTVHALGCMDEGLLVLVARGAPASYTLCNYSLMSGEIIAEALLGQATNEIVYTPFIEVDRDIVYVPSPSEPALVALRLSRAGFELLDTASMPTSPVAAAAIPSSHEIAVGNSNSNVISIYKLANIF